MVGLSRSEFIGLRRLRMATGRAPRHTTRQAAVRPMPGDRRFMFSVGVTRDFLAPDGSLGFGDIGLDLLGPEGISWEFLSGSEGEIPAEQAREFDGLLVLAPRV